MQVTSIVKARAVALVEADELNFNGTVRFADIVSPLVEKYGFLTYPIKPEDFDPDKGIRFHSGKVGGKVIDVLTIFPGLITLETLSSTADSKALLEDLFTWGQERLGLTYSAGMIRRWAYISQIVFYSEIPLLSMLSKPLQNLAKKTGEVVDGIFKEGLVYDVGKVVIGHDPLTRRNSIAGISIEHRANVKFAENKFFSEAPLPTDLHIRFLQEFEKEVMQQRH
jgi:hypothetical protein